jgi:tetratricopeptide (TPR) repeat protein
LNEARQLLETAVEQLPNDAAVLNYLGKLEMQEGRPDKAETWLRRNIEVDPSDAEARYALVTALELQGRKQETAAATVQYQKTKALLERSNRLLKNEAMQPSTDPDTACEIGSILLRLGQERVGVHWLNEALKRNPQHRPAHVALAEYYEGKGQWAEAMAHRRLARPEHQAATP